MTNKDNKKEANNKVTRQKLTGLPFEKASELKKASEKIRQEVWTQLERIKIIKELSKKEEYSFVEAEFKEGVTCFYNNTNEELFKISSKGTGIQININNNFLKTYPTSEVLVKTVLSSVSEVFAKTYYNTNSLLPIDDKEEENIVSKQ